MPRGHANERLLMLDHGSDTNAGIPTAPDQMVAGARVAALHCSTREPSKPG
jgi:hypothetical protein